MTFTKKEQLRMIKKAFSSKKSLAKENLRLWAELVKLKAGNKCEWWNCRKTEHLNAHHIFSRSHKSTKFLPENGLCFCSGHHSLQTDSAHKDPFFMMRLIGKIQGYKALRDENRMFLLEQAAKTPQKIDLKLINIYLLNEIELWKKNHTQP